MKSLRGKLLVFLLSIISVAWLATALLSYVDAHHEIDELFDAQLSQSARILLSQAAHDLNDVGNEDDGIAAEITSAGHEYERKIAFQIWSGGRLVLRSASAPDRPMTDRENGFGDVQIEDKRWRVYSQRDSKSGIQVQLGERYEVRNELAANIGQRLLVPMGVALPLLALLIWLGVGRGLSPLRRIGNEVARRDPANLLPLEERAVPSEVAPLLQALNNLLSRLGQTLESERRFTADAAHELRTPLAALKIQAQVALRAQSESQRQAALENLILGVDRATHLVGQLLTLARIDPAAGISAMEECDLALLAQRILADLAPAAEDRHIELELAGEVSSHVAGHGGMLEILLRNLVDNALRYTPPGGHVRVWVGAGGVEVSDSGPGIPPAERQRVFDRFYRVLGHEAPGSGLGLSIVKRIAELHGAKITLEDGAQGKGLNVRVDFAV